MFVMKEDHHTNLQSSVKNGVNNFGFVLTQILFLFKHGMTTMEYFELIWNPVLKKTIQGIVEHLSQKLGIAQY